ncbi:MAG: flavin-dependent monooxygenase, partial [Actinomycetota bacterium]|nr:flavin-dependent monooxygenase [Actinomycetota bacterium]
MAPAIGREDYLERVRTLLPAIRDRAAATEELGRIPDETIAELKEAGVLGGLQPRRWEGLELDPATFFEGIVLLGSACASTGWVASVLGMHPWEVASMHPDAQADVWSDDPGTCVSSSYAPTGAARREG